MRTLILIVAAFAMLALSGVRASASEDLIGSPIELRSSSVIDGEFILIGDIFHNVGDLATEPVAYAPDPGRQATYSARWLYQIARHFRLDWQPMSTRDVFVVERDSHVISRRDIEDELLFAISEMTDDDNLSVAISNRKLELHLPTDSLAGIEVSELDYDPMTRRVVAVIAVPAGDPLAQRVRVSGTVHQIVELPVPVRHIGRGEMITKADLEWRKVDATKVARDTVTSLNDIIGKAPRRGLRVGVAVRSSEIEAPELVARNSLVTISIDQPMMRLTAQGKALDAGSLGEVIRVLNTRSNKVVEATVTAAGQATVRVLTSTDLAMN